MFLLLESLVKKAGAVVALPRLKSVDTDRFGTGILDDEVDEVLLCTLVVRCLGSGAAEDAGRSMLLVRRETGTGSFEGSDLGDNSAELLL